ncbi:hypothetical protein KUV65_08400 [Maritalea mobilis]|uniref:Uncharacterized protein n=1 Tax=[Roseibacterium] beibuensis TaxID=1193142 RepID=A0ABP9KRJ4_9RHOB|nr:MULTISPECIES: hypothetical protein [Alphaproteobacteria]MBY6201379.1 hypothetical protein [Maritalea mobilis]MCS6622435.1 hypothetical protein [Roseibacterium beibuensis]
MTPFRLVIILGCAAFLSGATYLSWFGVARESGDLAASAASIRAGSGTGGGYSSFGRVK